MNKTFALTLLGAAATATALAQSPPGRPAASPPVPTRSLPPAVAPPQAGGGAVAERPKADGSVARTAARQDVAPGRAQPKAAAVPPSQFTLPPEPIEPFLLTKQQGPFMIMAYTFRGPDAAKYAQALAMELRANQKLPAYVFYLRIQPGQSNIRNVPPTAPNVEQTGQMTAPEKYRSYDEAAVLVGNYPTIDDAEKGLKEVKAIHPVCIDGETSIWTMADPRAKRRGLSRAYATQNPLVAAELLYPGRSSVALKPGATMDPFQMAAAVAATTRIDPLVREMNQGGRSLFKCPGPYTMVVAEYGGRSTFNTNDIRFKDEKSLRNSPLQTAHEDAENLANVLSRSEEIRRSGHKVYVFHDRSSSKVTVGAFQGVSDPANPLMRKLDPAAEAMRKTIMEQIDLFKKKDGELTQARYNEKTRLQPFDSNRGEFFHLTPELTLMPVPKD